MEEKNYIVSNETIQTKELHFQLNNFLFAQKKLLIIILILSILAVSLVFYLLDDVKLAFFLLFLAFLFPFLMVLVKNFVIKKAYNAYKLIRKNPVNKYYFYDNYLEAETVSDNFHGKSTIKYSDLYKIYINANMIILMINLQQVFIVKKDSFKKGNSNDLLKLFSSNNIKVYQR